jgi:hypothetical protein
MSRKDVNIMDSQTLDKTQDKTYTVVQKDTLVEIHKPRYDIETGKKIEDEVELVVLKDLLDAKASISKEMSFLNNKMSLINRQINLFAKQEVVTEPIV